MTQKILVAKNLALFKDEHTACKDQCKHSGERGGTHDSPGKRQEQAY